MSNIGRKTLHRLAVQVANGNWRLGDALVAECDGRLNGPRGYKAVAAELLANGYEYTTRQLKHLRDTSLRFPPDQRLPRVSWWAHSMAKNRDEAAVLAKARTKQEATAWARALRKHERHEVQQ